MNLKPSIIKPLILLVPLFGAVGCVLEPVDSPRYAPAPEVRVVQHSYVYYPEREFYYSPEERVWFWLDAGRWERGAVLPKFYEPYRRGGVNITLDVDRPFVKHDFVIRNYGRQHDGPRYDRRTYNDSDNDGIPNRYDRKDSDKDNDGVPNRYDHKDSDRDNDGVPNRKDHKDSDRDNDGIPNRKDHKDNDRDNDGVQDRYDDKIKKN